MSSTTINRHFNRKAAKQFRPFATESVHNAPADQSELQLPNTVYQTGPSEHRTPNTEHLAASASNALALQMRANAAADLTGPGPDYDQPVPVSRIAAESVEWILPGWIPAGKISVLFGEPGVGKSQLSLDIAARLTSGREMPNVTHSPNHLPGVNLAEGDLLCNTRQVGGTDPSEHQVSCRAERSEDAAVGIPNTEYLPSNVLLFSAEDSVADTIRPRLEAAGADCDRVRVFPAGGHGAFADPIMLAILIKTHAASLVIVDPLTAYAGHRDIYRDQHMRRMLAPLAIAAEKTGAAILLIHHMNKSARGNALMRSAGSIDITAAARSVMMVAKDAQNPSMRILAHVKGNLGAPPDSIRFHFVQVKGHPSPRIQWDGIVEDITADSLVQPRREMSHESTNAHAFLRNKLVSGPMPSRELEQLATEHGISKRTFERAKQAITNSTRVGGIGAAGEWITSLNNEPKS